MKNFKTKNLNNFLIFILIIFIITSNQITVTFGQFTPIPRYAASSQTIGDRLYVIGGQVSAQASVRLSLATKDVIYLKLSTNFSRDSPTWIDHTQISPLPVFNSWAGSCKDKDNKTIYLFGGFIQDINTNEKIMDKQIYVFDTVADKWTVPDVTGALPPARRREGQVVMDDLGKMYIFGGLSDAATGSTANVTIWFNDMTIFDSNKLTWTQVTSPTPPPSKRSDFTATYLPKSKLIIYIGGTEVGPNGISRNVNIKEILIFNTVTSAWSSKNAGGAVIENRYGHSAVLTSDDRIICYGGLRDYNLIGSKPELAVLDVSNDEYQWLAPVNTTANQPPSLVFHNAELYQDTMFIVFGNLTTQLGNLNREIFLFDTKSYKWMANFQPNPDNSSPTNSNSASTNDGGGGSFVPGIIAGVVSLVVIISGILVAFYILKRRKSKAEKIIEMPSSSDYNQLRMNTQHQ